MNVYTVLELERESFQAAQVLDFFLIGKQVKDRIFRAINHFT